MQSRRAERARSPTSGHQLLQVWFCGPFFAVTERVEHELYPVRNAQFVVNAQQRLLDRVLFEVQPSAPRNSTTLLPHGAVPLYLSMTIYSSGATRSSKSGPGQRIAVEKRNTRCN